MPSKGVSLLLMAGVSGSFPAESVDRFRLNRPPHMKYGDVLGPNVDSAVRALASFRNVSGETDNDFVRASARERECLRDALRILFKPYAPLKKGATLPKVLPRGITRTLSRIAKDAAFGRDRVICERSTHHIGILRITRSFTPMSTL